MASRSRLTRRGMSAMLKSDEVRALITPPAQRVLDAARASAPVASGAYRDGLHLVQATTDRAVVHIAGGTDHDLFVEAETGNLARALDAVG